MYKVPPSYVIVDAPGSETNLDKIREYKNGHATFTLFA
jgi:hypothetical protein